MNYEEYSEIFKALSHPIRLKIVCGLSKKENCNVTTMAENIGVSQPSISQHLNVLKSANIIFGYRKANQICYKLENSIVRKIIKSIEVK